MVISDFFHLRLGASVGGDQQHSYSLKVFIVFVDLGLPFPQVYLSWGGGGGGGAQQASSLSIHHAVLYNSRELTFGHNLAPICLCMCEGGVFLD